MDCNGTMETLAGDSRDPCSAGESKRVLILGGGFGGVYAALRLEKLLARHDGLEVTLVTRDNYFLFTPMLPEVAAGELEQSTIVNPLRRLLRRVKMLRGNDREHRSGGPPRHRVSGGRNKLLQSSRCRGFLSYAQDVGRCRCCSKSTDYSSRGS